VLLNADYVSACHTPRRAQVIAAWVDALRRKADAGTMQNFAANFAFAQRARFILKDERTFPQVVPASYLQAPTGTIETA